VRVSCWDIGSSSAVIFEIGSCRPQNHNVGLLIYNVRNEVLAHRTVSLLVHMILKVVGVREEG